MSKKDQKQNNSSDEEFQKKLEQPDSQKDKIDPELDAFLDSIMEDKKQMYPSLGIYAGQNGTFDMIVEEKKKTVPIKTSIYPLPLDTDIVKINAHTIRLVGYKDEVEDIGPVVLNASYVEIEDCPSLKSLTKMDCVSVAVIQNAPSLKTLPSLMNVREIAFKNTGLRYLPQSLSRSRIAIADCPDLEYIHPSISPDNIYGLKRASVLSLQSNYVLSNDVPVEEKSQYTVHLKKIQVSKQDLELLPSSFGRAEIVIGDCPNLKYIHPEVSAKRVHGLSPDMIYQYKMNYLFHKISDDDSRFDRWFKWVKREMKEQSRVR